MPQIMDVATLKSMQGRTVFFVRQMMFFSFTMHSGKWYPVYTNTAHAFDWKVGAFLYGHEQKVSPGPPGGATVDVVSCCHWDDVNLRRDLIRIVSVGRYLEPPEGSMMLSGIFTTEDEATTRRALVALTGEYTKIAPSEMQGRALERQCGINEVHTPFRLSGCISKFWRRGKKHAFGSGS